MRVQVPSQPGYFVSGLLSQPQKWNNPYGRVQGNSKDCYTLFFQLKWESKIDKQLIQDWRSVLPKHTLSGSSSMASHVFFSPPCSPPPYSDGGGLSNNSEPALLNHAVISYSAWYRKWLLLSAQRQSPGKGPSREGRPRSPMRHGSCLFMLSTSFWWTNGNKLCWIVQWQKQESWA